MKSINKNYCEAYERMVNIIKCRNCAIKNDLNLKDGKICPYKGKLLKLIIKIKDHELDRLEKYALKKGHGSVNGYIREAILEYLDIHEE